jgi:hypothetical protein
MADTYEFLLINPHLSEYVVRMNGVVIGNVWLRLGSAVWTNSLCGSSGHKTREDAARDLRWRFYKKEVPREATHDSRGE